MNSMSVTLLFAAALLSSIALRLWLSSRQLRHVALHRSTVPAAFAATVPLAAHQKAADYTLAKGRFGMLQAAFGAAIVTGWTLLGGLEALDTRIAAAVLPGVGPMAYQLALVCAFALIGGVLELPFDAWATFRIEQRFGFNRMSVKLWLADLVKGLVVGALIGLPLLALVLWLMAEAGAWWWLWAWVAWMGFNLLILVLYPTVIAPLFNKFEPLAEGELRRRVEALMQRCGFAASGLFVMDGSKRSAHGNAYFTGLGRAKRVVFFDTLLSRLGAEEVEAVLAHELGHFKLRHVPRRILLMAMVSLLALALLGWLAAQPAFYAGLGVQPQIGAPTDALALLLFVLALPPLLFFAGPLTARLSRRHEFEADAFAARHADGGALASALLKLHEDNASTLTPDPLYVRFYYSHPPAVERLAALPKPA
jgi:STE24 endopeptidase